MSDSTMYESSPAFGDGRTGRPLEGLRVVDFGWAWAGAVVGQIMADFGAEVIKVESRTRLDPMRQGRPLFGTEPDPEQNPICHNVNRNKRSLSVNLKTSEGVELIRQLVRHSDVLVENLSPGVLESKGLGYEQLKNENSGLVYVSLPAAGDEGPLKDVRAYAPTITALSGLDSLVRYEGGDPLGFQQAIADPNVGLHAMVAVLAALKSRKRTGRGTYIKTSQLRASLPLLGEAIMELILCGSVQHPGGSHRKGYAPHGIYRCVGDDAWVTIAVRTEEEWEALCGVITVADLSSDDRFKDASSREANQLALDDVIGSWTALMEPREVSDACQAAGVASMPCLGIEGRFLDDQLQSRENFVTVEHPVVGAAFIYGVPWKMTRSQPVVERSAPLLGEHTDYVLKDVLGMDSHEITRLRESDVLT